MLLTTLVSSAWLLLLGGARVANAIELNIDDDESIKSVAGQIAYDMMLEYKGNLSGNTPGLLPGPPPTPLILDAGYFWWEAGAMFGSLLDYWYYTGDDSYNPTIKQALLHQTGEENNYLPQNQSVGMGNDDQGFWGMSAMTAAEFNFENPEPDQPQWLALAQAVFHTQALRLNPDTCGGGLNWQAYSYLNGYSYKNSISNGCFFNIGSRLALYTKNETYAKYTEESWDWITGVGLIDKDYNVFDGADQKDNCTEINRITFSYNSAIYLLGAATMYNYTDGSPIWKERVEGLLKRTIINFFPKGIATELCEAELNCSIDMYAQKAFLTRWMAASTKIAPFIYDDVMKVLRTSAVAAAAQCSGGETGRVCGLSWSKKDQYDGTKGVGQQMAAMEVIQSLLIKKARSIVSNTTGGTSQGDPDAGNNEVDYTKIEPATTGGKVGAGILTVVVVGLVVGMFGFMAID
ncbi:hypothetical protein V493_00118 [Pseudogymnoascus sp. VKM F-4281 (FW-2241)]|nr:hypothetical protein V493_00118 [Pseudogymnoascus sp. VKM F-4281 (FW-2241)]